MKIFLVCGSDFYYKNKIFDINSSQNRDNAYYPIYLLRCALLEKGIDLNTFDYFDKRNDRDYQLIFSDIPRNIYTILNDHKNAPKFLILSESEVTLSLNWDRKIHSYFTKIFTWHDDLVDGRKYFKLNFTNLFPRNISNGLYRKEKLLTLIAQNKKAKHPLELYSKRLEAIRWFEKYHLNEFDLYGIGWDEYTFEGIRPARALNKLRFFRKLFAGHFPSYKGRIEGKKPVLEKYKFAICFENAKDIPGYITEKIFDCFFAGCVPIYWGANNVTDHIPKNCFIDKREFDSYEALYEFIKGMDDATYLQYLKNAQEYLNSPMSYEFTAECFAKTIIKEVLNG